MQNRIQTYLVELDSYIRQLLFLFLIAALAESKADLDAGRFVKERVAQHIRRINKLNTKLAA